MDLTQLGLTSLIILILFVYHQSRLGALQATIADQSRQLEDLARGLTADSTQATALQNRINAMESKFSMKDVKAEVSREVQGKLAHEVDAKVRALLMDERGKVNWAKLASSADMNPGAEVARHLLSSMETLDKRLADLAGHQQVLFDHALLLGGSNVCVMSSSDGCPHNMVASTQFALGHFQAEGKVMTGYLNSGAFNDNGWQWLQGSLCCTHKLP